MTHRSSTLQSRILGFVQSIEAGWWDAWHKLFLPTAASASSKEARKKFIPLGCHGDGGAFQKNDSINVISFRSLLSSWNVATSQMLLVALPKGCISKGPDHNSDTMHHIWKVLVWSFEAMFYNKFPDSDHQGKAWPMGSWRARMAGPPLNSEGYRGFIYAIQADGEYLSPGYGLRGASHEHMCFNCGANKSTVPYNDFRSTALWRDTVLNHNGTAPATHLVTQIPGICGESFKYDTLHVLEEGLTAHILANCCFDWVVRPGWHGTQDEKLKVLYQKICREYQEQRIESSNRIRRLPLSAFCNPKAKFDNFPSLSGIKARHCRYLVPVFLQICSEFQDPAEPYTVHRFKCLKNLDEVYQIMDASPMHPSKKQSSAFKKCMDTCLLHYSRLSVLSIERNLLMWNTVPKFHLAAHLADQFKWMNPKFYSCYAGETMVGHMSALAHRTLNGTAA